MPSKQTHSKKSPAKKATPASKTTHKASAQKAKPAVHKEAKHASSERRAATQERRNDERPAQKDRREVERRPAGAHATGPADFVITRKWTGKTVEAHTGQHVRVELPESTLRGMSWQLAKLPHGVELSAANVETVDHPQGQNNQNRVFDFACTEEGEFLLQFTLQRPFDQRGVADTFKVKVHTQARD